MLSKLLFRCLTFKVSLLLDEFVGGSVLFCIWTDAFYSSDLFSVINGS